MVGQTGGGDDPINSRTVIVHRIPIASAGSKAVYSRSTSLTTEPTTGGWRATIAKLIRAKSTSGNTVGQAAESSPSRRDPADSPRPGSSSPAVGVDDEDYQGHIDICVIQATPAASPCASIRSTLSGDSLDAGSGSNKAGSTSPPPPPPSNMSVRDRRKRFARMKGQTIEAADTNLPLGSASLLAPPSVDFGCPSLLHPVADLRCRSTSPTIRQASGGAASSSSSWLQVLSPEPFNRSTGAAQKIKAHSNKSLSAVDHLAAGGGASLSTHSSSHI